MRAGCSTHLWLDAHRRLAGWKLGAGPRLQWWLGEPPAGKAGQRGTQGGQAGGSSPCAFMQAHACLPSAPWMLSRQEQSRLWGAACRTPEGAHPAWRAAGVARQPLPLTVHAPDVLLGALLGGAQHRTAQRSAAQREAHPRRDSPLNEAGRGAEVRLPPPLAAARPALHGCTQLGSGVKAASSGTLRAAPCSAQRVCAPTASGLGRERQALAHRSFPASTESRRSCRGGWQRGWPRGGRRVVTLRGRPTSEDDWRSSGCRSSSISSSSLPSPSRLVGGAGGVGRGGGGLGRGRGGSGRGGPQQVRRQHAAKNRNRMQGEGKWRVRRCCAAPCRTTPEPSPSSKMKAAV